MTKKKKHLRSSLNRVNWYESYGFSSSDAICNAYPKCGNSTLWNYCKKFNGDKDALDNWYENFVPYRSKKSKQTKDMKYIRSKTGRDRASINYDLNRGYTKEEIILAYENNIDVRYIRTSYILNGKLYTLHSYCEKRGLHYRKLNKLRKEIGNENFKDKLEKGELDEIR